VAGRTGLFLVAFLIALLYTVMYTVPSAGTFFIGIVIDVVLSSVGVAPFAVTDFIRSDLVLPVSLFQTSMMSPYFRPDTVIWLAVPPTAVREEIEALLIAVSVPFCYVLFGVGS